MIKIRCKKCNLELQSSFKIISCGCPNMTSIDKDKIFAKDLSLVEIILHTYNKTENKSVLSAQDLAYQEARKQRIVRRLQFEEK